MTYSIDMTLHEHKKKPSRALSCTVSDIKRDISLLSQPSLIIRLSADMKTNGTMHAQQISPLVPLQGAATWRI